MTEWQHITSTHREKQQNNIPKEWKLAEGTLKELRGHGTPDEGRLIKLQAALKAGLLTDKEIAITEKYSAGELLARIARGELTSSETTIAFCKRAAIAQQLTSCLTEIFFEEAIERAKLLDEHLAKHGSVAGPLHGLPISLKDSFIVKGHHATVGYTEFLKRPIPDDHSALVELLLDAGAVLYCKTNVPQTMMTADSENNIFGRTLNPHKTTLTAGGSTGGEGALLSFRGSPLGVGTDIAGSIRIPSLCCGVYGFKPTSNRIPFGGQSFCPFPRLRLPGIMPVAGPMASSFEDLKLFMETVIGQKPWKYDSSAIDIPWRPLEASKNGKLTIGILPEDAEHPLHPPVRRAIETAIDELSAAGHTIVRLPVDHSRGIGHGARIAFSFYGLSHPGPDGLEEEFGEPLVNSLVKGVHPFTTVPPPVPNHPDLAQQLSELGGVKFEYSDNWRKTWLEYDLDVVIAPGAQSTAVPWDEYGVPAYTAVWNVLDYPACIIPYGTASKAKDPHYVKSTNTFDPDYDADAMDGAPCAIQVITPSFRDEECLYAAQIINDVLNNGNA
ncbi:amidase [Whalleya microplaca]|nr:amidase [Whalleya microplaca]